MDKRFVWVGVILGLTVLIGCEKKAKVEEVPMETEMYVEGNMVSPEEALTISETGMEESQAVEDASGTMAESGAMVAEGTAVPTGKFENISIADIQKALKNADLYAGTVDGVNGPKTKKAVKEFQAQNSLKADGKVGPKTWKKLEPYLYKTAVAAGVSN